MTEASRVALQTAIKRSEQGLGYMRANRAQDLVRQHELAAEIHRADAAIAEMESGITQMKADLG